MVQHDLRRISTIFMAFDIMTYHTEAQDNTMASFSASSRCGTMGYTINDGTQLSSELEVAPQNNFSDCLTPMPQSTMTCCGRLIPEEEESHSPCDENAKLSSAW